MPKDVRAGRPRGRRHAQTARYRPRRWFCVWYAGVLTGAVALLVGLAYLIGHGPKLGLGAAAKAIASTLVSPAVAAPVAFALLVVIAWSVRRLRFEWLAWRPGPIQVLDFDSKIEGYPAVDQAWLTGKFRERLGQLSLQAPNPVPGAAPEGDFLGVLGESSTDLRDPTFLLKLAQAASVTHAYEVQGRLQVRDHKSERCGVAVQLLRLPHESSVAIEVWGTSWGDTVRYAADEATAAILPRTRVCRRQWLTWRGLVMPPKLLCDYERGVEHERCGRYAEALERYYEVLGRDPFNLAVRLRIGQLHEQKHQLHERKQELHEHSHELLAAFSAYYGIVDVTLPAGHRLPRTLYRRHVRRERERIIAVARYRRAILLAGDKMASQWVGDPRDTPEAQAATQRYRAEVEPYLLELAGTYASTHMPLTADEHGSPAAGGRPSDPTFQRFLIDTLGTDNVGAILAPVEPEADPTAREAALRRLRVLFAAMGLAETQQLARSFRVRFRLTVDAALQRLGRPSLFTPTSLRLSSVCIRIRLAHALNELRRHNELAGREQPRPDWGDVVAAIPSSIASAIGARLRQWHEGYIAACVYGIPLLYGELSDERRHAFAEEAVKWIERATACADSAFVASRRTWVLDEDPDLAALRDTPEFRIWRSVYFPSMHITER